jgi:hypothetical protein
MKTAFLFIVSLGLNVIGVKLFAQTSSTLQLDVEYYLPPARDSVEAKETFFRARFSSSFSAQNFEQMQTVSARRIFAQLKSGRTVYNYSSVDIGHPFYPGMEIGSCRNLNPSAFAIGYNRILPDNSSYQEFSLEKNGNAFSQRVTISPDFRFQTRVDSVMTVSKNGKNFVTKAVPQFLSPETSGLLFVETWNFNPATGKFRKNINQIGYMEMLQRNSENLVYVWTACIDNGDSTEIHKQDILFKKDVVTDVAMRNAETRIEYDSLTWHFTGSDALNEMEMPMGNVPAAQCAQFLAALMSYAFAHPENVYPVSADMKIDSLHPFGKTENLEKLFAPVWDSTVQTEDPNNPGIFIIAPLEFVTSFNLVYGLRFYEDWYFDPNDFVIKKRVKGIGLLMIVPDPFGGATILDEEIYIRVY